MLFLLYKQEVLVLRLCGLGDTELLEGVGPVPTCELSALHPLSESDLSVVFAVLIILSLVSVGRWILQRFVSPEDQEPADKKH